MDRMTVENAALAQGATRGNKRYLASRPN